MFTTNLLMITCLLNSTFVESSLSVHIDKDTKIVSSAHMFDAVKAEYNNMNLSVLELTESKVELSGVDQNSQVVRVSTSLVPDFSYGQTTLQVGSQTEVSGCYVSE